MAVHDDSVISRRGDQQANIAIAFLVLSWVFIILRVWTRTYIISNIGWDDFTMIAAGMVFTAYCATMIFLHANGGGTHITSVDELNRMSKWIIVGQSTYVMTTMLLKISLAIFFARIVIQHWQLRIIQYSVGVNIVSSIASFFYVIFRCGSNPALYGERQLEWKCTPRALDRFFAYQSASVTTLTDCIFAILPIFILWDTRMDRRTKISVGLILSLAALGCVCSMIRFQYVDGLADVQDFFWNAVNIAIWSTIEPGAGIIAGCLATLRPLFKPFFAAAKQIRSSAPRTPKELSISFRSGFSSSQKSAGQSQIRDLVIDTQPMANDEEAIELKSETSRTRESTDAILRHRNDDDLLPSPQDHTLDLDCSISHPRQMETDITITHNIGLSLSLSDASGEFLTALPAIPPGQSETWST